MRLRRTLALAPLAAVIAGCATSSSYKRWEALRQEPAFTRWVHCIGEQTRLRMTSALDPHPPTPEAIAAANKTDGEVFVEVLAACKQHMAGFGDNILEDKRNKRMLMDAYDRYRREHIEIRSAEEASII
jgi:hypothetical protein